MIKTVVKLSLLLASVTFFSACTAQKECVCPKVEKEIVTVVEKCPAKVAEKKKVVQKVAVKKPVKQKAVASDEASMDPRELAEKRRAELEKERDARGSERR